MGTKHLGINAYTLLYLLLIHCFTLPTVSFGAHIVWSADHETGDLSQWDEEGPAGSQWWGSYDNGDCLRPPKGVTSEQSHSGEYSVKMSLGSWDPDGGCRQFRYIESRTGDSFYYSSWLYFPTHYVIDNWANVIQFKSQSPTKNNPVWVLELRNRNNGAMYFMLTWQGVMAGPTEDENKVLKHYHQTVKDVPENQWIHIEVYLKQSSGYTGRISFWQDGVQIYDMDKVKTKYPDGDNRWSINAYGDKISPMPFTVYVDDTAISTTRIGPQLGEPLDPPSNLRLVK
ncbi:MAG: hypothetical protein D8M57_11320 [Candidatus Scalindua sp. AMX11]|nr:MAG: hypothetical protein DWQ00_06845 [Candidatus Scalindua sp.]NOG83475.1 hypothetical protein [Planctomycetota bacterium]RZV72909.1 MAG: hypothetical protein EX341_13885 [Candidatus Scalindua sp. SCAELEC01]TDE64794.1 MAG: hypothetical protein D8M57_11320 [Candidatus Scalindua sp. AMX11]GJQ59824.1 MAG: hypothetical protein SCALA701_26250 [Candidatus Scalindua sp.]